MKPTKGTHGKAALAQLRNEWVQWLKAGMPPREPITEDELKRRIALLDAAIRGGR